MTAAPDQTPESDPSPREAGWTAPTVVPRQDGDSRLLSILGFVSAAVALLFFPIIFGPVGVGLGIVGHIRGESLGRWAAVAAAVAMLAGMALGALVRNTMSL